MLTPWKKTYDQPRSFSSVAQSCPTVCNPMDCSLPGSSIPRILQAGILEWVAISFSNLDSILKSKDITLPTKVCLVKAMVFPVVVYRSESWTIKKAECRIDDFEMWCWRRLSKLSIGERIPTNYHLSTLYLNDR